MWGGRWRPDRRAATARTLLATALGGLLVVLAACTAPAASPPAASREAPAPANAAAKPAAQASPAAAAPAPAAPPTAGPLRKFDLGVVALVSYFYPMWIAVEKGFWAAQGLEVELTTLGTNEAVAALVSGSLDVLMCPTDTCVTALSKGASIRQVNDYLVEAPYNLMARADQYSSVDDLRGKRVAVSSLSAGTGSLAKIMLRARGLGPDDYQLVQAGGNPQRYVALQSGGVDAALLSDPINFSAVAEGYRSLLSFSDVVPDYSFTSDWVLNSWLEDAANRDALVRFQAGQILANRWAQDPANRAATVELLVRNARAEPAIAERVYDFYIKERPGIVGVDDLKDAPTQSVISILRDMEDLPPLPPDAQWKDASYIQRARQLAAR